MVALSAGVLSALVYVTITNQGKLYAQSIDFNKRLLSRFCAAANLQAEQYAAVMETREEIAQRRNEERRMDEAGQIEAREYLR